MCAVRVYSTFTVYSAVHVHVHCLFILPLGDECSVYSGVQVYNIVNVYYDLLYLYIHEHVYLLAIDW